jgi:hypothetical protein
VKQILMLFLSFFLSPNDGDDEEDNDDGDDDD